MAALQQVHEAPAAPLSSCSTLNEQQDGDYIKKPPNASMLLLKEEGSQLNSTSQTAPQRERGRLCLTLEVTL
ncbi:hypothetical protein OJAV_G00070610 [Oryzias javanicus]|uniref:Uncharacterized protein n=1 Tax=Oryzias javanicus TaxID=123683 RepID=A0A3S2Q5U5_ORYJA|nr:hypothetical protein OJAV_G00070610 [Oryzias javanicus]